MRSFSLAEPDSHTKSGRESGSARLIRSVHVWVCERSVYVNEPACEDGVRGTRYGGATWNVGYVYM